MHVHVMFRLFITVSKYKWLNIETRAYIVANSQHIIGLIVLVNKVLAWKLSIFI